MLRSTVLDPRIQAQLPEFAQVALDALREEPDIAIKGGLARLCLIETLATKKMWSDVARSKIETGIKDLDLVFLYHHTIGKDKDYLLSRFDKMENYLATKRILLKGEDVRPIKGGIDEPTIKKILTTTADLTINECLVANIGGKWMIFYTPQCERDLIEGVGFLDPQDGHIRYSAGRVLPSNLGWARMIKFLVQEKIRQLYIPAWWPAEHLRETERQSAAFYNSKGLAIGLYGLSLMEKYGGENLLFQQRAVKILAALGFSPTRDPNEFVEQQKQNLKEQGKTFALKELSFGESLENTIYKQRARETKRHNRNVGKEQCEHMWEEWACDGCSPHCTLRSCALCKASETTDLPCNKRIMLANWPDDHDSLWTPPKF